MLNSKKIWHEHYWFVHLTCQLLPLCKSKKVFFNIIICAIFLVISPVRCVPYITRQCGRDSCRHGGRRQMSSQCRKFSHLESSNLICDRSLSCLPLPRFSSRLSGRGFWGAWETAWTTGSSAPEDTGQLRMPWSTWCIIGILLSIMASRYAPSLLTSPKRSTAWTIAC